MRLSMMHIISGSSTASKGILNVDKFFNVKA